MKALYIAPFVLLMTACGDDTVVEKATPAEKKVTTVYISGKVTNPKMNTVTFGYYNDPVTAEFKQLAEAQLDSSNDNTFEVQFELKEPAYVRFATSNETSQMYLSPGDSLHLTIDTDQFDETIAYEGRGAEVNNYLADKYLKEEARTSEQKFWEVEPVKFHAYSDSVLKVQVEEVKSSLANNPEMQERELARLKTKNYIQRFDYPKFRKYYLKEDMPVNDDYYLFTNNVKIEGEPDKDNFMLIGTLLDYQYAVYREGAGEEAKDYGTFAFEQSEKMLTPEMREQYLANTLYNDIRYNGAAKTTTAQYDRFRKTYEKSDYLPGIRTKMKEWEALTENQPAPDFKAVTIDGTEKSLSDYRGKLVYIDVWATWCGPCKAEMPHNEELQKEMKGLDIVFMGVSIDEDKEAWEKMVREKNMSGEQLFIEGAWNSTLTDMYKVAGIPRFILIDRKGNIIDANAPRPSSGDKIRSLINQHLTGGMMAASH